MLYKQYAFKLIVLLMFITIGLTGCAGTTITPDPIGDIIAKSAGRYFGCKVVATNPDLIAPTKAFCADVAAGNVNKAIVDAFITVLGKSIGPDPLLLATFMDVVSLFTAINTVNTYDIPLAQAAAIGILDGLTMCQPAITNMPNAHRLTIKHKI
jgi:hypothetical protein